MAQLKINLLGNPFDCACSHHIVSFISWLKSNNSHILYIKNYKCAQNGKYLDNIDSVDFEEGCQRVLQYPVVQNIYNSDDHSMKRTRLILTVSMCIFLISGLAILVIHKHKWRLKWLYYNIYCTLKGQNRIPEIGEEDYDIFVAYSDNDLVWVIRHLVPLEEQWHIQFCLKDRDFRCDVPIAEAIVGAIGKTRKTILVITDSFVEDEWCYFTLQMALGKGLGHLVVVLLDEIDIKHPHSKLLCVVMDNFLM